MANQLAEPGSQSDCPQDTTPDQGKPPPSTGKRTPSRTAAPPTVEKRKAYYLADFEGRRLAKEELASQAFQPPDCGNDETLELELARESPEAKYAVDELLVLGGNALITAQRKTGKTILALNLAKAYADNEPFLGRFQVEPLPEGTRVLMLNYELDPRQFRDWARDMQIKNPDRISVLHLRGQGFKLVSPAAQKWLVEECKRRNAGAMIVDPYSKAFNGFGGSNDNDAAAAFTDMLEVVKYKVDARELYLTNHAGWATENGELRSRGASSLEGWPDALWRLDKNEKNERFFSAPLGRGVELEQGKLHFDPETRLLTFGSGTKEDAANDRAEQIVIDFVNNNVGAMSRHIHDGVKGLDSNAIGPALFRAIQKGKIRTEGKRPKLHYPAGQAT